MAQQRIEITQDFSLPVERVFKALADHNNLSNVFGIPVKRIHDGVGDVNGVGSVRALGFAPLATEETIVDVEPNVSIDYEITKNGGPLRNHHGRIDFEKTGRGSRVTWVITFDSFPVVGPVVNKVLTTAITRGLRKIS
jgi:uncharacterized protein YndB with AHSA1/START domain